MILGLTLIAIGVILATLPLWYKLSLHLDSWGDPDPEDMYGWCFIFCLAFLFGSLIFLVGITVLGGSY